MEQLIENIKKLRKEKGLTQQDIADVVNMHRSNYSKVEKGERELSVNALVKLAELFGVTLDELVSSDSTVPKEIIIKDKSTLEQANLLQELNEEDKNIVFKMIEALLTKKRFINFFEQNLTT